MTDAIERLRAKIVVDDEIRLDMPDRKTWMTAKEAAELGRLLIEAARKVESDE